MFATLTAEALTYYVFWNQSDFDESVGLLDDTVFSQGWSWTVTGGSMGSIRSMPGPLMAIKIHGKRPLGQGFATERAALPCDWHFL